MAARVDFWFDFASTYSHLSAYRIGREAAARGVTVRWRPFLLGPIFAAQGWTDSPFNLQPVKGRYMWRDMARRAERFRVPFRGPDAAEQFPRRSLLAARVALAVLDEPWGEDFCRAVFAAEFADWQDIADPVVIDACLARARGSTEGFAAAEVGDAQKAALRANGEEAVALGLFGAPSFVVGDEIFWGDDRLEDALDWAVKD
ncbi:2-hydroxychromene-2-carboxylate isomerase [Novosphingobium sp. JCM 18896]|uniref:2-hydroxychromene-2-carboxylate isomerase n=1 Tax=Novosphingobium sp. JCM 18896 TaxID=2989731 RepID=UPI0022220508|nr:2-hydroxychromene-2-carboxylate isomerase [Novosphingobium sp. JCM 18896]MCW1431337.1 2-hydroxychromene-2-carboxylate isomerase [Novosphingobium sp. JCM 18896]